MDKYNRVKQLMAIEDDLQREKKLAIFLNKLNKKKEALLQDYELQDLCRSIKIEKNFRIVRLLWLIVRISPFNKCILIHAKDILESRKGTCRDFALEYVFIHEPEKSSEYIHKYKNDSNQDVLFTIAQKIFETDSNEAINMMIDFFPKVKEHELYDCISIYVSKHGKKEHLEKMIRLKKNNPELENHYDDLIEGLEEKYPL